ncbi:CHAT domain-containing protein [Streptomyces sp. NPDC005070]
MVDVARVLHVPAWSVIGQRRSQPDETAGTYDLRLAVIAPDGDQEAAVRLKCPPTAHQSLGGPLPKKRLSEALRALDGDRHWLLYLAGHIDVGENPTRSGLRLAPEGDGHGHLSIAEMLAAADRDGRENPFPLPERVLAVGCGSLGHDTVVAGTVRTPTSEWLGFGSALMLAGTEHAICTLYPVYPVRQLNDIAHRLAERLVNGENPADALREVQLAELERWRRTGQGRPFLWQAFVYTGVGV